MTALDGLLRRLQDLPEFTFPADSIDDALELRDRPEFESEWLRVDGLLESGVGEHDPTERLREAAFKLTYARTNHPELAGYVADDFALIGAALLSGLDDPWLNSLWVSYRDGRFPCMQLDAVSGSLQELIDTWRHLDGGF